MYIVDETKNDIQLKTHLYSYQNISSLLIYILWGESHLSLYILQWIDTKNTTLWVTN
jgi:hypothetical protein